MYYYYGIEGGWLCFDLQRCIIGGVYMEYSG